MAKMTLRICGMGCSEEVETLKRAGGPLVGGEANLAFDLLAARMIVLTHPDAVTKEAI